MWSNSREFLVGNSIVPYKIRKLLKYRFIFASILGFMLDYQMLGIFLGFQLFEVSSPLISLRKIIGWTFLSLYTTMVILIVRAGVTGYGLLLCRQHYAYPRCFGSKMKRISYVFPIQATLLCSILSVSIGSSLLYASFAKDSVEGNYHLILGLVSGIFYFRTQHGCTLQRFPLPIVRLNLLESILLMWWPSLKRSGKDAFGPTIIISMLFWLYMESILCGLRVVITKPELLFRGWLINTLIMAKLHMARELYGLALQNQLPLTVELRCQDKSEDICLQNLITERMKNCMLNTKRKPIGEIKPQNSLSLPISLALDGAQLYGFRMLAARDFYAEMSGILWTNLFDINEMRKTSDFWEELREVLYKIINDFLVKLDSCLETAPQAQVSDLLKRQKGIRSLTKYNRPKRIWCCPEQCENIQTHLCICNMKEYFKERIPLYPRQFLQSFPILSNLFAFLYEPDKLAKLNHVLQCSEPLVWILQGLVCICARSLIEDSTGLLQRDLSKVIELLIKVERKLLAAAEVPLQTVCGGSGSLCHSHKLLMLATNRCLFRMLRTFGPHLDFIVTDQALRAELQRIVENLNVF